MSELLWITYSVATTILPVLCIYVVRSIWYKHRGYQKPCENIWLLLLLSIYIGLVFYITGSGTLYDYLRRGFEYHPEQINFVPLILNSYPAQYVLNVIMFLPLGILLPTIWPQIGKFRYIFGFGFALSMFIELSQLLNFRASDVDDLIMNVLGAIVGFALLQGLRTLWNKPVSTVNQSQSSAGVPVLYLIGMAVGSFTLYNAFGLTIILSN